MILYYSATGNTEYIAKELARRLDDECIDLLDRIKKYDYSTLHSDKPFIICAPVYVCEMPRNYVANNSYPMLPKEEVEERIINSHKMPTPVAEAIKAGADKMTLLRKSISITIPLTQCHFYNHFYTYSLLSKSHIKHHHHRKSRSKHKRTYMTVSSLYCLWYKFFNYHIKHCSCCKA